MSLPELLHHQDRFVGSLSLRRVQRLKPGDTLSAGPTRHTLSADDAHALAALARTFYFELGGTGYDLSIQTQALDYPSLKRCPALGDDQRCAIHADRKPAVCSMVPFDALFPDRLQAAVLASRDLGEDCIKAGLAPDSEVVFRGLEIQSADYRSAVDQRRRDLLADKDYFGHAVFAMLKPALLAEPGQLQRIPVEGFFTMSLIPALVVFAGVSEPCRTRILAYVDSQLALIDGKILKAGQRRDPEDFAITRELSGYLSAYLQLRPELQVKGRGFPARTETVASVETYLGIVA